MPNANCMFMVAIDPLADGYDVLRLKDLFGSDDLFKAWWHHIPGCFLVTSHGDVEQVSERTATVSGDARLLVFEVKPEQSEGHLAPRNWDWIRRRESEYMDLDRR